VRPIHQGKGWRVNGQYFKSRQENQRKQNPFERSHFSLRSIVTKKDTDHDQTHVAKEATVTNNSKAKALNTGQGGKETQF
jgi:hypothetical protein